ncbi:hypothetical protein QN277_018641 [Acacia crassicarpa]|uniref:Peptidase A1 domain-containing protein n=1 Tax=Acacia crassicarpa TaxID=499986 RepID=A0AAE1KJR0_9FABA|nr:hypothetical protein QN277_018641 [Acacia crassicarpa]
MVLKGSFILISILILNFFVVEFVSGNLNNNGSSLAAVKLPDHPNFDTISSSNSGCAFTKQEEDDGEVIQLLNPNMESVKLHLKHKSSSKQHTEPKKSLLDSTEKDLTRIQTFHKRVMEKKNQNTLSRLQQKSQNLPKQPQNLAAPAPEYISSGNFSKQMVATLESGVTLGSGEYFIDVFIGTPPKHFSLILDTGSDLNWIQCEPCFACFDQNGPHYNPKDSTSHKNINCDDPRCELVSSPDPPQPCNKDRKSHTCPYFYWYGDSSNTTGDFASETFTVNLTNPNGKSELKLVENVMFGCGHWNRGLFHGAAGLLGLGRGPLSFASQLQSLYGHSFSYCLVDRNSDTNVTSKLIFGEDKDLLGDPGLNFTSFVGGKENPVDTFYYLQIKSLMVDGEILKEIPENTWALTPEGSGGTIIDSGTTLTYFAEPAYQILKEAFEKRIKGYHKVEGYAPLGPCYNVSGLEKIEIPDFGILFADGAVWNLPVENYFIEIEPERVVCLAILGTPRNGLSIIGNYQQQNFHILYDTKKSRLGYAPMNCADV